MKHLYEKHTKQHHYQVHDTVMLWRPTHKKGISRCWQPKWSGPWTIVRLVGEVNCQLINAAHKLSPVVHVNQLRQIPKRSTHLHHCLLPAQNINAHDPNHATCDICNTIDTTTENQNPKYALIKEGGNDESNVYDLNVLLNPDENNANNDNIPDSQRIEDNWCRLEISNILPRTTRSNSVS